MNPHCTVLECEAAPECARCHKTKAPRGRDVPMEAAAGYCGYDCAGYQEQPRAGHLWPGELERSRENDES